MSRVQDKGGRLFVEWKERYKSKVEGYLESKRIFRGGDHDTSEENRTKVIEWANRWRENEVITS